MKKSSRIISASMAALMAASMLTVGAASASAATLKKPTSVKAVNTSTGIKLTWKSAKGAVKYTVYRGKKALKSLKKLTYTDKTAKAGKKYTYTVKSVNGKKTASSKSVTVYRLKAPTGVKLSASFDGLRLKWKKSTGASKYEIYRKVSGGKYKLIKTVGNKSSYTDTTVENGTKYTYKLKAYKAKSASVASASATKTYVAVVSNLSADVQVNGDTTTVALTWDKNDAAAKYRIIRYNFKTQSELVKETLEPAFTDEYTNVNPTYITYSVVAVKGSASYQNGIVIGHYPKGSHFTDSEGNVNVNLKFKKGDVYEEGAQLLLPLAFVGSFEESLMPTVEVVEGTDVVTVDNGIITANAAGSAKIKVTIPEECAKVLNLYMGMIANGGFNNKLETGVVYINVTVEE